MRTWFVIPAMSVVAAATALVLGAPPGAAIAAGLAGAGVAAAIRAIAGDSPAFLAGAVIAPLLAVAGMVELSHHLVLPCIALAAAGCTVAELARPTARPLVAMLPAAIAAVGEPGFAALIAIAGTRLVTAPERPPWALAGPIAGGVAIVLAILAGTARGGMFAALGAQWFGAAVRPTDPATLATMLGQALGPIGAVAALGGLVALARVRIAEAALACCIAGVLLVDLRAGAVGPTTLGIAALSAGLAVGRFASVIRLPAGQAIAAATIGFLLLLPPVWTVSERVAITGRSR